MSAPRMPPSAHRGLMLRTCAEDMSAHGGFVWPRRGYVAAPDWSPTPHCGEGLHGLAWGEGDGVLLDWSDSARWLVVAYDTRTAVALGGKIKVPEAWVVCAGSREAATAYLSARAPGRAVVGGTATVGDHGTATVGYRGHATAGVGGHATAGFYGHATVGDHGTAVAGAGGHATAGFCGHATAGDWGTAVAGACGTATAGVGGHATVDYDGTATAGDHGTATAGAHGTATAGYRGTATAGAHGTATAGNRGEVRVRWDDGRRGRLAVGYVGEGILPGVPYRVVGGVLVRADGADGGES